MGEEDAVTAPEATSPTTIVVEGPTETSMLVLERETLWTMWVIPVGRSAGTVMALGRGTDCTVATGRELAEGICLREVCWQ